MVVNGITLLAAAPIKSMLQTKVRQHGVSHGLGEAGYDIRIAQEVHFKKGMFGRRKVAVTQYSDRKVEFTSGRFAIASAMEEFNMPTSMMGIVHDKSTWARRGLSVFNTVIEPGWQGFLTLELDYKGEDELIIPAGAGIAQVIFHLLTERAEYGGKYQNQENKPVPARSA